MAVFRVVAEVLAASTSRRRQSYNPEDANLPGKGYDNPSETADLLATGFEYPRLLKPRKPYEVKCVLSQFCTFDRIY